MASSTQHTTLLPTQYHHLLSEYHTHFDATSTTSSNITSLKVTHETQCRKLQSSRQIDAATEVLNAADTSATVVRVNGRFAVKVGLQVPLIEAETMKFLAANSKVRIPKVYDAFVDPESNKTYIIMDHVPGDTLRDLLPSLGRDEKARICELIKNKLTKLRSIPAPDYLGMIDHSPYLDGVFWNCGLDPKICGPFASEEELNCGMIEKLRQTESEQYIRLLRTMMDRTLHGHRTLFTHGDLQPKNIMVERLDDGDGAPDFKITLIDWESAGWYPEYWDFCNATVACRFKRDWLELVPDILDEYPLEFLMMQVVYSSVYY
ncbi:aminoglycoside phosphotransferase family protein [Aspergillus mulundensis]|uniref:Protein kinase domain-containing protein n=1 Tax=Aspergillus mulundensis TaxID=1810919 RepID=A0A3D8S5I0_9EURO|nr:Uncharacterized protein DSM5745_05095 [Aspergillus mulundensis]RDW81538.1 Uncharacterized protein DSM5745_05095 [Aspergillus mulundensis]